MKRKQKELKPNSERRNKRNTLKGIYCLKRAPSSGVISGTELYPAPSLSQSRRHDGN
jgi:hypothetical protein